MKHAAATWALVVGIDAYDHVSQLTGAANDAALAVRWLRKLGVPDAQILLHAAPGKAAEPQLDALEMSYADCTEPDLWKSFMLLRKQQGERLIVVLCGHGFFEPGGARVFLTREFEEGNPKNIGVDWYAALLRSIPFARQYIVMDGCLNLPYSASVRSGLKAGEQSGVALPPPLAQVRQTLCCSASQGERAREVDGHGLFFRGLMQALDPDDPDPRCVDVDDATGARILDLNRAVLDIVAPEVIERTGDDPQRPGIQPLGAVASPKVLPIVELPASHTARVTVTIDPGTAAPDVKRLSLWSDDNAWRRELPIAPAKHVQMPYDSCLPVGLPVVVWCAVKDSGTWVQPAMQQFSVAQDRAVVFRLEPAGGPPMPITVNTVDASGQVVSAMSSDAYEQVARVLAEDGDGIDLERHETGPVLLAAGASSDQVRRLAFTIASVVTQATPPDIAAVVRGIDVADVKSSLTIPLTAAHARRLGGALQREPLIEVGSATLSLERLVRDPVVEVEDGPVTVRVRLPWGAWTARAVVKGPRSAEVRLPLRVGAPPLRVRLLRARPSHEEPPPRSVATTGKRVLEGPVVDAQGKVVGTLAPTRDWERFDWLAPLSTAAGGATAERWRCYAVISDHGARLAFPLNEHGAVALHRGRTPRAEPLSRNPSPHWDRLVATGRLKKLDVQQAETLTYDKWNAPLLGLAGAYACNAHNLKSFLSTVLGNLERIDPELPDLPILQGALDRRNDTRRPDVAKRLAQLGASRAVPLFRWGVALGILVARHYEDDVLAARLQELERQIVASSVWTLWHH